MTCFKNILQHMEAIHESKDNDYSGKNEFANFYEAERVGVEAWKGAFIRLQDKYARCCNLISGTEQKVEDEKLEDTLMDLAIYSVIVLCLREQRKEKKE